MYSCDDFWKETEQIFFHNSWIIATLSVLLAQFISCTVVKFLLIFKDVFDPVCI